MQKRAREPAHESGLDVYREKRDFERTPEPRGKPGRKRASSSFVVQKHAARALHHDFRLELDGVLLSWAVPKGPPIVRGRKALAVRVEDHPLAYGSFEGVIPPGEYGGGTVMLWDHGTWRPASEPRAALDAGKLDFELEGERLRGRWTLVRTAGRDAKDGKSWLLIKRSDEREDARAESPELDRSVTTGRTMQEIAAGVVRPRAKTKKKQKASRKARRTSRIDAASVPAARRRKQPLELAPQLATLADAAPEGEGWIHELKYDGYRLLAFKDGDAVRLATRSGLDWTERFPTVAAAVQALPVQRAIDDRGRRAHPSRARALPRAGHHEGRARRVLRRGGGRDPAPLARSAALDRALPARGRAETCFYQKHVTEGMPEQVRAIRVSEQGGASKDYVAIDDLAGLVSLVQIGALELHPWGARADRIERPDRVVIDLDPGPDVAWKTVVAAAAELRSIIEELGLESFLRTTGGKGLHVVLPIERRSSWDEVKQFARDLSAALARRDEERFVLTATKARRQGRIFLDYLRNARGATAVASYSSRARPGATVATPLAWDELGPKLDPSRFTVLTVPQRIARRKRDPWAGFFELRQSLTKQVRAAVQRV